MSPKNPSIAHRPMLPWANAEHLLRPLAWIWSHRLSVALFVLLAVAALPAWRHLYPATAASGWTYSVRLDAVERVSALVADDTRGLYISQEIQNGEGRILRLAPDQKLSSVELGLSKPDGMVRYQGGVALSQEQGEHPVLLMDKHGTHELFSANSVEGLATDGHYLYAVEDLHGDGRLLRYDPQTGQVITLRTGLDEAEGIASCPNGRIFYTEKQLGHIKQLQPERRDTIVARGLREPGFLLCNNEGLWVTEDATHMARVLRLDAAGTMHTVLSHLRSPQTIIETAPGRYLVAEQGRNRILELQREAGPIKSPSFAWEQ